MWFWSAPGFALSAVLKFILFFVQPFQPAAAPLPTSLAGWMANTSNAAPPMPHPAVPGVVSGAPLGLAVPPNTGNVKLVFLLLFY